MPSQPKHPGADALERYSMGAAGKHEAGALETHLLLCGSCRARLAETDAFVKAMQAAAKSRRTPKRKTSVRPVPLK